jgi:hypothetical protein
MFLFTHHLHNYVPIVPNFQPLSHELTNFITSIFIDMLWRHLATYLQLYQIFWSLWECSWEEAWWCLHWDRKCSQANSSQDYHDLSVNSKRQSHVRQCFSRAPEMDNQKSLTLMHNHTLWTFLSNFSHLSKTDSKVPNPPTTPVPIRLYAAYLRSESS